MFLNAAVSLETTLAPEQLHALLRRIELDLGRRSAERWAARPIDLDLLLFDEQVINTQALAVPHPRMAFRRFVLAPAAEVAADMVHPLIGWTIGELLAHLDHAAPYLALLGLPGSSRETLAERVALATGGLYLAATEGVAPGRTPDDPSGHSERRAIQFLDHASRKLSDGELRKAGRLVISDFYFDECLAWRGRNWDDHQRARIREAWGAASQLVAAPKLLVVLDTWDAAVTARVRAVQSPPQADRPRLEMLTLATRPGRGPVLFAGDDPHRQFDEIMAAIAAMN
jgi:hypothetical protein